MVCSPIEWAAITESPTGPEVFQLNLSPGTAIFNNVNNRLTILEVLK